MPITHIAAVEQVLRKAPKALNLKDIAKAVDATEKDVGAALKQLAQAGQIELVPGGRNGNRYAWLSTTEGVTEVVAASSAASVVEPPAPPYIDPETDTRLFLLRVPKRKPRVVRGADRAESASLAAVRNGAVRADVFLLQPIGCATRGALWTPAA